MNEAVIQTSRLTRYFGSLCAVDQVSLDVPRGSVFALLGRNGSGKSTLLRMILGMLSPTRGGAKILGQDSQAIMPAARGRIGFVAEGHPVIDWMRVGELEAFQKSFYPKRWDARLFNTIIEHFNLSRRARASQLSRGQQAGLSIALALASCPELLVMDDPALGLDPVARRMLLETIILVNRNAGRTVLFSSHILDDVERVADHIAILDRSVLKVCCPLEVFRERVKRISLMFTQSPPELVQVPGLVEARADGNELHLTIANYGSDAAAAISRLGALAAEESPLSLEDAVIGYLAVGREKVSLLQSVQEQESPLLTEPAGA